MMRSSANQCRPGGRRGAALYSIVMMTALLISLLALAGLAVMRVESEQTRDAEGTTAALANARSAVEWAIEVLNNDVDWRTNYTSGVPTAQQSLGPDAPGALSWMLVDSDSDLTDADTDLRLVGIGRADATVQAASVRIRVLADALEVHNESTFADLADDFVSKTHWVCQFFRPVLPAGTTAWRITAIDFYGYKNSGNRDFDVRQYQPLASNMPSATLIDSVTLNSNDLSPTPGWITVTFTGETWMPATDGVCLAFESTAKNQAPIGITYRNANVTTADSALITGDTAWATYETDQALLLRVRAVCQTLNGQIQIIAGSWKSEPAP